MADTIETPTPLNLPQMTERMREIMGEKPSSPSEAAAAAEDPVEPVVVEAEPEAVEEAVKEAVDEEDDIAWVKGHLGFETDERAAKAIREREKMVARQGTEVGEARKLIEEERAAREAFQAQVEQRMEASFEPDEEWEEWALEAVSSDPLQAIIQAGENAGPAAARFVLSRWHMVDPASATAFQVEAARVQEDAAPSPSVGSNSADAWGRVALRHPDLAEFREAMTTIAAEAPEEIRLQMEDLARTHPEMLLENLYLTARVGQTDHQRKAALAKANAAKKAAADKGAADATVASATASPTRGESVPLTEAGRVRAAVRAELGYEVPED
jgi:hypothetical protein